MALKLDGLSAKELQSLINEAESRMATARKAQIQSVRAQIDTLLKRENLQLGDVYPERSGKPAKRAGRAGAGIPKYRNPNDPSQTWSGFGKRPAWFQAAQKRGIAAESMLVEASAPATRKTTRKVVAKGTRKAPAKRRTRAKAK